MHAQDTPVRIPLYARDGSVRAYVVVDAEDAPLQRYRWHLNTKGYVIRSLQRGGKRTSLGIHREIMGEPAGLEVDHVDGDRLNNRRSNLRVVTHAQQTQNRAPDRGSTSRFRGVSWNKAHGRWMAYAQIDGTSHHLGYFDLEEDAAATSRAFREERMTHTNEVRSRLDP